MTDRLNALIVVLENDMREDDAQSLIDAIHHLRGVSNVVPRVAEIADVIAESRVRRELEGAILGALRAERVK